MISPDERTHPRIGAHNSVSPPTCSLLIRCYNEEAHLPVLLKGIERQSLSPTEVIVVDSGSTDNTTRIAASFGARILHIARDDFSFGRALNMGAEASTSEILVIASAHVYPTSSAWLELLVQPFHQEEVALVYGGQQGVESTKFSEHQIFRQWFPRVACTDQQHPFCNNANAAVRRSVWTSLRYDESIPGLEDIHWAKRALERGHKIAYQPDAMVAHVHRETYRQIFRRYKREGIGLRSVYPWETMTLSQALALYLRSIRSDFTAAWVQKASLKTLRSIPAFRLAQYWGAYRGLNWRGRLTEDVRHRLYYPPASARERTDKRSASTIIKDRLLP